MIWSTSVRKNADVRHDRCGTCRIRASFCQSQGYRRIVACVYGPDAYECVLMPSSPRPRALPSRRVCLALLLARFRSEANTRQFAPQFGLGRRRVGEILRVTAEDVLKRKGHLLTNVNMWSHSVQAFAAAVWVASYRQLNNCVGFIDGTFLNVASSWCEGQV